MTMTRIARHATSRKAEAPQLDLFAWGAPPEPKRRRAYYCFIREENTCRIGPHWWFGPRRCINDPDDGSRLIPDLKPIRFLGYQFRAEDQDPEPAYFWVINGKRQERRTA